MVLLGKVWATATPDASDAAASAVQQACFNMVLSSVQPSDPGQRQLPGKPVGRPASIAIGAIVGIVPAVLDDQQLYRTRNSLRQPLRMRSRHEPVLAPGHYEDRTRDFLRRVFHRQARSVLQRIGLAYAVAAHAERLARQQRQSSPDFLPLERPGERDAGADAPLVCGRARRVVAAETHAPHGDLRRVEIRTLFDPVARGARGALVVAADRDLVLRLALPRPVDRQDRDATREERLRVGVQLFLRGIQARRHDQYRRASRRARRSPQDSMEGFSLERYRNAFPWGAHKRKRVLVAFDRLQVRVAHLLLIVNENELGEVVVHRRAHQVLARGELVPLRERLAPERLVHLAALAPGAAPVLPPLDPGSDLLEIGEQHAVRHEARRPVRDRRRDARVDGPAFYLCCGHNLVLSTFRSSSSPYRCTSRLLPSTPGIPK